MRARPPTCMVCRCSSPRSRAAAVGPRPAVLRAAPIELATPTAAATAAGHAPSATVTPSASERHPHPPNDAASATMAAAAAHHRPVDASYAAATTPSMAAPIESQTNTGVRPDMTVRARARHPRHGADTGAGGRGARGAGATSTGSASVAARSVSCPSGTRRSSSQVRMIAALPEARTWPADPVERARCFRCSPLVSRIAVWARTRRRSSRSQTTPTAASARTITAPSGAATTAGPLRGEDRGHERVGAALGQRQKTHRPGSLNRCQQNREHSMLHRLTDPGALAVSHAVSRTSPRRPSIRRRTGRPSGARTAREEADLSGAAGQMCQENVPAYGFS